MKVYGIRKENNNLINTFVTEIQNKGKRFIYDQPKLLFKTFVCNSGMASIKDVDEESEKFNQLEYNARKAFGEDVWRETLKYRRKEAEMEFAANEDMIVIVVSHCDGYEDLVDKVIENEEHMWNVLAERD